MVLKFTQDGKFLMQIGKPGQSKGSNDIENLRLPAKTFVDPKTNELYVADGYGNHRVIVFDADTGKYKRHWGAYGHKPDDADLGPLQSQRSAARSSSAIRCTAPSSRTTTCSMCATASTTAFRSSNRTGRSSRKCSSTKNTLGSGSVWDIAFSKDPQQKYIYLADGENDKVHILDRESLEVLTSFGDGGRQPGEFYGVHSIATDSKGNIYTTETYRGQRVQKFVYKGMAPGHEERSGRGLAQGKRRFVRKSHKFITAVLLRNHRPGASAIRSGDQTELQQVPWRPTSATTRFRPI